MTKHPYEFGGILFTIAVLGGILGGVAFDNFAHECLPKILQSSPLAWNCKYHRGT